MAYSNSGAHDAVVPYLTYDGSPLISLILVRISIRAFCRKSAKSLYGAHKGLFVDVSFLG